jgi:hypothetical protein
MWPVIPELSGQLLSRVDFPAMDESDWVQSFPVKD